jgi:hypothetical protein
MKIELHDEAGGTIAPASLTCHGTPIGSLGCGAMVSTSESAFHGYAQARCGNCGRWGMMAWEVAIPNATKEEVRASMCERAADYWETKPTTSYGDLT